MRAHLLVVFASTLAVAPRALAQCECPATDTLVIGHRGAGVSSGAEAFSENTIESAQQAFTEGADMVEIDVQTTMDGAVVLMHDDTVDRTTDGTGCVSALTLAQIQALDAGSGTRVPTLAEFLAAVSGGVNIEIKLHETDACPAQDLNALVDAVVADVIAAAAQERVIVSSFALAVLQRLRTTEPSIEIGYLSVDAGDIDVAAAEGFEAIHLLSLAATARNVRLAHEAGLRVNVWTVNGASAIEESLAADVDAVITDTADEAVAARTAFCEAYVCPGADAGVDAGTGGGSSGGCGCRASGDRDAPIAALVMLALVAISRRRRGRVEDRSRGR